MPLPPSKEGVEKREIGVVGIIHIIPSNEENLWKNPLL